MTVGHFYMFCIVRYLCITVLFNYSAFELQVCSNKVSSVQFSLNIIINITNTIY